MCSKRGEKIETDQFTLDLLQQMKQGKKVVSVSDEGVITWISKEDHQKQAEDKLKLLSEYLTTIWQEEFIQN